MKRLTPEEREQQWQNYFNKTGDYAEPEQSVLRVDTQTHIRNVQFMSHNTQITHVPNNSFDLKKLEREVTVKTLMRLAIAVIVLCLINVSFN